MSAVLETPVVEAPHDLAIKIELTDAARAAMTANGGCLRLAESYEIDSHDIAELAAAEILAFNKQIANITAMHDDLAKEPKATIAKLRAWFVPGIKEREEAIGILKTRLKLWNEHETARIALENKRRQDEADRVRREAEAKARAEQERAAQIARDKQREADEQEALRAKAEAEGNTRAAAAAAAAKGRAEQESAAAIQVGQDKAEHHHMASAAATTTAAPKVAPKVAGVSMKDNWIAKLKPDVTEAEAKRLIVAAAPAAPMLLGVIEISQGSLNKLAKGLHEAFDVPGYVAFNDRQVAGKHK